MQEYLIYTFLALFLFGFQTFLYKVSAYRKCNSALTTLSFMITVAILSAAFFIFTGGKILNFWILLIFSALNAVFFLITTLSRMEALKHIPTNISYPIIKTSTIFVVGFSIIYFKDKLSYFQITGIILAIAVLFILFKKDSKEKIINFKTGMWLTIIAMVTSALTTIVQKFAALNVDKLPYITLAYVINIFLSLTVIKKFQSKTSNTKKARKEAWIIGFFIGILNFAGFYSILNAYSLGPLSIAGPLHDLNFVVAIILAAIFYKEKITKRVALGIILSILSVIFLSMA